MLRQRMELARGRILPFVCETFRSQGRDDGVGAYEIATCAARAIAMDYDLDNGKAERCLVQALRRGTMDIGEMLTLRECAVVLHRTLFNGTGVIQTPMTTHHILNALKRKTVSVRDQYNAEVAEERAKDRRYFLSSFVVFFLITILWLGTGSGCSNMVVLP